MHVVIVAIDYETVINLTQHLVYKRIFRLILECHTPVQGKATALNETELVFYKNETVPNGNLTIEKRQST